MNRRDYIFGSLTSFISLFFIKLGFKGKEKRNKSEILTKKQSYAKLPNSLYSNDILFLSEGGVSVQGGIENQTLDVLSKIKKTIVEHDLDFSNIVKTTIYLQNIDDYPKVQEIILDKIPPPLPVCTFVSCIGGLVDNTLITIECIALKKD